MYKEQDLINILAIYQSSCNGDIRKTRKVYASLYGTKPSYYIVKKAIKSASKRAQKLEKKPAAAENNQLIDCQFLEDSFEVKEEVIIDEEDDNSSNSQQCMLYTDTNSTVLDTKLHQTPVVYTTRLNDMNIFKGDLNSLTVNCIMKSVTAESKPQLKQESQVKSEIFTKSSLSFDELLNKVEQYNLFATSVDFGDFKINDPFDHQSFDDEGSSTEKELLDLCTPLWVVLTDCKIECSNCYVKLKRMLDNTLVVHKFIKCRNCNPEIDYNKEKEEKEKEKTNNILARKEFGESRKCFRQLYSIIVMKNLYSNTTEIYYILYGILKGYYYLNHVCDDDYELFKFVSYKPITEYINCCWESRNTKCKKLWPYFDINTPPLFLLDSHPCPHNDCECCCRRRNISLENNTLKNFGLKLSDADVQISSEQPYNYQDKRSNLLSITKRVGTDTWINNALQYSKKLKPTVTAEIAEPASIQNDFAFQIESSKHLEHYTLRNGKIHSYFEINRQSSEPSLVNSQQNVIKGSGCCWLSRERFLTTTFKEMSSPHFAKTTHDIVNFFKTPHPCSFGSCRCCCSTKKVSTANYANSGSTISEQIELPMLIKKSSNYNSKHVQTLKLYKKLVRPTILKSNNATATKKSKKQTVTTSNPSRVRLIPRILRKPAISVPLLPQKIEDVEFTINQPENASDPLGLIQNPDILNPATQSPAPNNATIQDPLVKTMIANVLERFKNIRLTLNSEGKVVAELDTPVTNLSKTELEILSSILTHAQQQVNVLGIANHVTQNLHAVMRNPLFFIPELSVPENTNPTAINSLFPSEAALTNQNPNYNNLITNQNVTTTTNMPSSVDGPLILKPYVGQRSTTFLSEERKEMESTVACSTDLYHAFTTLTYLKKQQYRQSFTELTLMKNIQYQNSLKSQPSNCELKIKDVYCLPKKDEVAATVHTRPTLNNRVKRKSQNNSDSTSSFNNSAAKRMRMTPITQLTGDVYVVDNQSNFSQPLGAHTVIPDMTQPVFLSANSVLSTAPPCGEPLHNESNILMDFLSTPKMFNDNRGVSSSDILEVEDDEDDCILGV